MRNTLSVPRPRFFLGFCFYVEERREGEKIGRTGLSWADGETLDWDMGRWKDGARDGRIAG